MIIYDVNVKDKKSFKEIKYHLNNDKAINNNCLIYIIGINFDTKSKKIFLKLKNLPKNIILNIFQYLLKMIMILKIY